MIEDFISYNSFEAVLPRHGLGRAIARAIRVSDNGQSVSGQWRFAADAFEIDNSVSVDDIAEAIELVEARRRRRF